MSRFLPESHQTIESIRKQFPQYSIAQLQRFEKSTALEEYKEYSLPGIILEIFKKENKPSMPFFKRCCFVYALKQVGITENEACRLVKVDTGAFRDSEWRNWNVWGVEGNDIVDRAREKCKVEGLYRFVYSMEK